MRLASRDGGRSRDGETWRKGLAAASYVRRRENHTLGAVGRERNGPRERAGLPTGPDMCANAATLDHHQVAGLEGGCVVEDRDDLVLGDLVALPDAAERGVRLAGFGQDADAVLVGQGEAGGGGADGLQVAVDLGRDDLLLVQPDDRVRDDDLFLDGDGRGQLLGRLGLVQDRADVDRVGRGRIAGRTGLQRDGRDDSRLAAPGTQHRERGAPGSGTEHCDMIEGHHRLRIQLGLRRTGETGLRSGHLLEAQPADRVLAYRRVAPEGEAVVAVNLSDGAVETELPLRTGMNDLLTGAPVTGGSMALPAWGFRIFGTVTS